MRKIQAVSLLLIVMVLGNLACSKSGAAALPQEEKYKLYWAAFKTDSKETMKDVIKKLGIGDGNSSIPDHDFYIAFIDWTKTDAADKFAQSVSSQADAVEYLRNHMPK